MLQNNTSKNGPQEHPAQWRLDWLNSVHGSLRDLEIDLAHRRKVCPIDASDCGCETAGGLLAEAAEDMSRGGTDWPEILEFATKQLQDTLDWMLSAEVDP